MISLLMREVKASCLEVTAEKLEELSDDPHLTREEMFAKRRKAIRLRLQTYDLRNSYDSSYVLR